MYVVSHNAVHIFIIFRLITGDFGQEIVKSAAVSLLPNPPTKPVVSDVTDTSVHLSWSPGVQTGQSPVSSFYVEYFGYETTDVSTLCITYLFLWHLVLHLFLR